MRRAKLLSMALVISVIFNIYFFIHSMVRIPNTPVGSYIANSNPFMTVDSFYGIVDATSQREITVPQKVFKSSSELFLEKYMEGDSHASAESSWITTREGGGKGRILPSKRLIGLGLSYNRFGRMFPVDQDSLLNGSYLVKSRCYADVHVWLDLYYWQVHELVGYPLFPRFPTIQSRVDELSFSWDRASSYGERIFGILLPPYDGYYHFLLRADDSAEFWLASIDSTSPSRLVASVGLDELHYVPPDSKEARFAEQVSPLIHLHLGSGYYFEVLHVNNAREGYVHLLWRRLGESQFSTVGCPYILPLNFTPVSMRTKSMNPMEVALRQGWLYNHRAVAPFQSGGHVIESVQGCLYTPTYPYASKTHPQIFHFALSSRIHVKDIFEFKMKDNGKVISGNDLIDTESVLKVSSLYKQLLLEEKPELTVERIVNIEENPERRTGKRYLIEVDVTKKNESRPYRISEYIFFPTNSSRFCYPAGYQISLSTTIYVITATYNQANWLRFHLHQLSRILEETGDTNVEIVITDSGSQDIDLDQELEVSGLARYRVIRVVGAFKKTVLLNRAVSSITDPNAIIFIMDLHLVAPNHIFDLIRKRTIQGIATFAPILFKLQWGESIGYPLRHNMGSRWCTIGYGMISIYKSDWDRVGGMDEMRFRRQWGGEDWDFANRVLRTGLEIIRIRVVGFIHVFHLNYGTWDGNKGYSNNNRTTTKVHDED